MNKLKNLLQFDASKYIFLTFLVSLYIFSYRSYLAIIIFIVFSIYLTKKSKNLFIYALVIILIITYQINRIDNNTTTIPITGEIKEVKGNHFILNSNGNLICYYDKTNELEPGMVIKVYGKILDSKSYQIPNTFDYDTYLKSENIKSVISVDNITKISKEFNINIIKYNLIRYINNNFSIETASYLKLFLLGEKDEIYKLNNTEFTLLGISHLFSISGMHLGLIVGFLSTILKKLYISKEKNRVIIMLFLIIYNVITGFKTSIIRATLLLFGIYIKDFYNILLTKTDLLSFSFIGLLIYNPYLIYSIGFQLSYLIAFSIIMGSYLFKNDLGVKKLLKITVLANIISLPVILSINHSIGLIFVFSNIFFIYYVTYLFLPLSFITIFIHKIEFIYIFIIKVFNYFIQVFSNMNMVINFNFTQPIYTVIYWICIFILITKTKVKRKYLAILSLLCIILINISFPFKSNTFIRFLDVNQGDSIHVHSEACDMLIDTGEADSYNTLINYLEAYNIKKLDILLITHFHTDHYGELVDIDKEINITKIYTNNNTSIILNEVVLKENDSFSCGLFEFTVLNSNNFSSNENNNSIVLLARLNETKILLTGDMESELDNQIILKLNEEIDIIKVPHHGSNTSSSSSFIDKLNPKLAIISVGKNNLYGHPDKTVIKHYEDIMCKVLRTDESGTITIYYYKTLNITIIETYLKSKRPRYWLVNI